MNPSGDLFVLLVSLIEFVDASCRVHEFHLSCIERVGCVGDFDFYYRILYAVDFERFAQERVMNTSSFDISLKATRR